MSSEEISMPEYLPEIKKVIPLFFLIDKSGSMNGFRISAVNDAMHSICPAIADFQQSHPEYDVQIRCIEFGEKVRWCVGDRKQGVPVEIFTWVDIPTEEPNYGTPTDQAINLLLECIGDDVYREYLGRRFSTPIIMLISDGESSDPVAYSAAINNLRSSKVGKHSILCAIGIETDGNPRAQKELQEFGQNGYRSFTDGNLSMFGKVIGFTVYGCCCYSIRDNSSNAEFDVFAGIDRFSDGDS